MYQEKCAESGKFNFIRPLHEGEVVSHLNHLLDYKEIW
jgi:hypothetical protein